MKREDILDVYKSRFKQIRKYYRKLIHHYNEDDNHNFRVEIKKLRAFLRLVNVSNVQHPTKIPKTIKEFYRLAGDIRNLELHTIRIQQLCEHLFIEEPLEYIHVLDKEGKKKRKEITQITNDISLGKFRKRLIKKAPAQLSEDDMMLFVENTKSALLNLIMLPFITEEAFHEIRKLLKDLMYNYEYLEHYIISIIPFPLKQLKTMESLTSVLGNFHDLCLSIYFISPAYLKNIAAEILLPADLEDHLLLRKENMRTELEAALAQNKVKPQTSID